ncbi:OLC1v1009982C1 [Oldenlandia corymbosa var. corymbosa]|uniref:OLC1v1009982C1 n=1 Tax=Oldenlandia corymbosa var. corymbosa TaxID=529605 RepID=A0AAV1DQ92_OLDCO|nr:OLC1v1009982C1 [Oldenlandia corymbosa var. corymbosa]
MAKITDLPEAILQQIFSLLRSEGEGIKASLCCKPLMNAWLTRPDLVFDFDHLLRCCDYENRREIFEEDVEYQQLLDYLTRTLRRYHQGKVPIRSFTFKHGPYSFQKRIVKPHVLEEWVRLASENGAKIRLNLLYDCYLPQNFWEWKNLAEDLMSYCNSIEDMEILFCTGLKKIVTNKLPRLKRFRFRGDVDYFTLEIQSPSLEFLTAKMPGWNGKLTLHPCQNLKYLRLKNFVVNAGNRFFEDLDNYFPNLQSLRLGRTCVIRCDSEDISKIKVSSSSLERLQLKLIHDLDDILVRAPRLNEFVYHGYATADPNIIGASSLRTSTLKIVPSYVDYRSNRCKYSFDRVKELIKKFGQSRLSLVLKSRQHSVINLGMEQVRDDDPHIPAIERLSVEGEGNEESLISMLDRCFWCCRPKILSVKWWGCLNDVDGGDPFLERAMKTEYQDHDQGHIKFWQRDLKRVQPQALDHPNHESDGRPKDFLHFLYTLDWDTPSSSTATEE